MTVSPDNPSMDGPQPGVVPPLALMNLQSRIVELVDTAIVATDLTGTIIYANPYASTLYGWSNEELVGSLAVELAAVAVAPEVEADLVNALTVGGSWERTFDVDRRDGTRVSVHNVSSPLYGNRGELIGLVSAGTDATRERLSEELARQQQRAGQISQFLADCGTALAASQNYDDAIDQLGRTCVPFLGDLCLIDVTEGTRVRRMVAAHHDPEQQALVDQLERTYPPDPTGPHPAIAALRSGATSLSADMSDDFLRRTTRDATHYEIVKSLNFVSYICVPLMARGCCWVTSAPSTSSALCSAASCGRMPTPSGCRWPTPAIRPPLWCGPMARWKCRPTRTR
jgi:PAS domain S-box-containing protein